MTLAGGSNNDNAMQAARGFISDHSAVDLATDGDRYRVSAGNGTIIIIEPRVLIRDSLTHGFQASTDHGVVACSESVECRQLIEWLPGPLVVLLHASSQAAATTEIMRDLRLLSSLAPTVVMAESEEPSRIVDAFDHGAKGYIPTSVSVEVALGALGLALAGGEFVPAKSFLSPRRSPNMSPRKHTLSRGLTQRETAIAEALRQGKTNPVIASQLSLRESTVKVHIRNIMRKLKTKNRTEVAYWLNNRLFGRN